MVLFNDFSNDCWRALARQLPILYYSEKKAKSVGCKIEDMRSRSCFLYPGSWMVQWWLSRKTRDFYVFGCSILWAILPIREWRCQDTFSIKSYFMRSLFFSVSRGEVLAKITSFRSKLPTAACLSREKKRGNCEAKLLDVESDFGTTDTWRHIIHSVLRPLRR